MDLSSFNIPQKLLRASLLRPKICQDLSPELNDFDTSDSDQPNSNISSNDRGRLSNTDDPFRRIALLRSKLETCRRDYEQHSMKAKEAYREMQSTIDELVEALSKNMSTTATTTTTTTSSLGKRPLSGDGGLSLENSNSAGPVKIINCMTKGKFLPRKPRSILFPPVAVAKDDSLSDLMITTSLDGSMQLWSIQNKSVSRTVHFPSLLTQPLFAEDICWGANGDCIAIALNESSSAGIDKYTTGSRFVIMDLDQIKKPAPIASSFRPAFFEPKLFDPSPHTKSISVIAAFKDDNMMAGSVGNAKFLTGSLDKTLVLWSINFKDLSQSTTKVSEVHRRHTSAIFAICQPIGSNQVWTGGNDSRLVGWDMAHSSIVYDYKSENRYCHLLTNSHHPKVLLASLSAMSGQMRLVDLRSPTSSTTTFGWTESANTSRYLCPSWHSDGNLIACGSAAPISTPSGIYLWDLRCIGQRQQSPLQIIECGVGDKRYLRSEFSKSSLSNADCLVALAADGSVSFVDFHI